jgi:hypothetical protein
MRNVFFKITTFTELTAMQDGKGNCHRSAKRHPPQSCKLTPLISVEATEVCLPVGNDEVLLAAVYKSPGRPWIDADIINLLGFKRKTILAGNLKAKHQFWNSSFSNHSGKELLELFHKNEFEISAPQYPTHYSHAGNGDVLDIVVHQNIRLSDVTVSDILDSDHLPIIYLLKPVNARNLSKPTEKVTDWKQFQNIASELISPRLEINSGMEADKAARDFTASIASAYRLSTTKGYTF